MNDWNTIKRFVCKLRKQFHVQSKDTQTAGYDLFSSTWLIDSCFLCCKNVLVYKHSRVVLKAGTGPAAAYLTRSAAQESFLSPANTS